MKNSKECWLLIVGNGILRPLRLGSTIGSATHPTQVFHTPTVVSKTAKQIIVASTILRVSFHKNLTLLWLEHRKCQCVPAAVVDAATRKSNSWQLPRENLFDSSQSSRVSKLCCA
ncbi:hypothetical protein H8959_004216 [Pygathrix nigripes]